MDKQRTIQMIAYLLDKPILKQIDMRVLPHLLYAANRAYLAEHGHPIDTCFTYTKDEDGAYINEIVRWFDAAPPPRNQWEIFSNYFERYYERLRLRVNPGKGRLSKAVCSTLDNVWSLLGHLGITEITVWNKALPESYIEYWDTPPIEILLYDLCRSIGYSFEVSDSVVEQQAEDNAFAEFFENAKSTENKSVNG